MGMGLWHGPGHPGENHKTRCDASYVFITLSALLYRSGGRAAPPDSFKQERSGDLRAGCALSCHKADRAVTDGQRAVPSSPAGTANTLAGWGSRVMAVASTMTLPSRLTSIITPSSV
ncbi:hypothetical protein RAA17_20890 [Komagataeibacter rhaeticus]|nr:hypothetical protein [Komagataeibacter rhaeticus]